MTNDDAVKIIKAGGWGYPENMVTEANMMAIDALEYRTPKKPNVDSFFYPCCPNLQCTRMFRDEKYKFCPDCGQALDWPEVE